MRGSRAVIVDLRLLSETSLPAAPGPDPILRHEADLLEREFANYPCLPELCQELLEPVLSSLVAKVKPPLPPVELRVPGCAGILPSLFRREYGFVILVPQGLVMALEAVQGEVENATGEAGEQRVLAQIGALAAGDVAEPGPIPNSARTRRILAFALAHEMAHILNGDFHEHEDRKSVV